MYCELCLEKCNFELSTEIEILLIFEKAILGWITQAVKRYSKAPRHTISIVKHLFNPEEIP